MNRLLMSLLLFILSLSALALACMDDSKPNVVAIARSQAVLEQLQKHELKEPWEVRRDRLRKELADGGDYHVKYDLAAALCHTGQAAEAIKLLEEIEAEKPGIYVTAFNLGRAYELAGNTGKAQEWILRGIDRNAHAHEGTEWLHVRILEAKLALLEDPKWLESNSVLGPRKQEPDPFGADSQDEKISKEQVKAALIYQLHERLQFVPPPDAIAGAMLLDLGERIGRELSGLGGALGVFQLAGVYLKGASNVDLLRQDAEQQSMNATLHHRLPRERDPVRQFTLFAVAAFTLSLLVVSLMRRIGGRRNGKRAHVAI